MFGFEMRIRSHKVSNSLLHQQVKSKCFLIPVHENKKSQKCQICNESFYEKCLLKEHVKGNHINASINICSWK